MDNMKITKCLGIVAVLLSIVAAVGQTVHDGLVGMLVGQVLIDPALWRGG